MEYIQVLQNLRRAGRADWGKKAKQTAGINDLKFAAQGNSLWSKNGILTLTDFEEIVGEQKNSLTQIDDLGKAIRNKQTAINRLETFQRLKPISAKSKRGMGFMRKQYAKKHLPELNEFAKTVRYMNANGIKAADHERIADELQQLLDEQAQLRAALAEQNADPDLIDRIRYCVDTVIKTGGESGQRGAIRVQLKIHPKKQKPDAKDDILSEKKETAQLL